GGHGTVESASLDPPVPGHLVVAPAVERFEPPLAVDHVDRVAAVGPVVEPAGVLGRRVDAAVADVLAALRPHGRGHLVDVLAAGGDPHRPGDDLLVAAVLLVVGVDAHPLRRHDRRVLLAHGQVDAPGGEVDVDAVDHAPAPARADRPGPHRLAVLLGDGLLRLGADDGHVGVADAEAALEVGHPVGALARLHAGQPRPEHDLLVGLPVLVVLGPDGDRGVVLPVA